MVKPTKRPASVLNNANNDGPTPSKRVTRSNNAPTREVKLTKATAIVPKKRKIPKAEQPPVDVPESSEVSEDQDEKLVPSSSQDSQASDSSSSKKGSKSDNKRGRKVKDVAAPKNLLPLPVISDTVGTMLAVGAGDTGQLGLGEDQMEKTVVGVVPLSEPVCSIVAGAMHSVCLTKSGVVYTFGCNDEGALGRLTPNDEDTFVPGKVEIDGKIVQISAGDSHSAALTELGKVFIWGNFRDFKGKMGLTSATENPVPTPMQILKDKVIVQISSGANHFLCLDEEGHIYSCGNCEHGQLGRINSYSLERGGRKGMETCLKPDLVKINRNVRFDRIWGGTYTSYARARFTGEIYGFGLNNYSQLAVQNKNIITKPELLRPFSGKKWLSFSGGEHHTLALDMEGQVYSLGRFEYGRLGLGTNAQDASKPTLISKLQDVECVDISCGSTVSFAVDKNGLAYSWGCGTNNQLGHNSEDDEFEPRQIITKQMKTRNCLKVSGGGQHALFIASDKQEGEAKENGE